MLRVRVRRTVHTCSGRIRTSLWCDGQIPTSLRTSPNRTSNKFCYDVLFGVLSTLFCSVFCYKYGRALTGSAVEGYNRNFSNLLSFPVYIRTVFKMPQHYHQAYRQHTLKKKKAENFRFNKMAVFLPGKQVLIAHDRVLLARCCMTWPQKLSSGLQSLLVYLFLVSLATL